MKFVRNLFLVVAVGAVTVFFVRPDVKASPDSASTIAEQKIVAQKVSSVAGVGMPDMRFGGTWSYFGGPEDMNAIREVQGEVGGSGLAAIDNVSTVPQAVIDVLLPDSDPRVVAAIAEAKSRGYMQGIKLIGRLNPESYYIAMRWPIPYLNIRNGQASGIVTNNRTGISVEVAIVDWGPAVATGKDADLSQGIISALDLRPTDTISFAYKAQTMGTPPGNESALSQFQNVSWNTPQAQPDARQNVFTIFSPLIPSLYSPFPQTTATTSASSRQFPVAVQLPKNVLAIGPLGSLARFMDSPTGFDSASNATGPALGGMILTRYYPVRSYAASEGIEGGWATSRPGPTGSYTPSTLDMVRTGESNYVTLAGDPSRYGEWYTIPEISYTNAEGESYTLYNVRAYVHDTGSAFRGRPDKLDIATDEALSDSDANRIQRMQESDRNVQLIPTNGGEGPGATSRYNGTNYGGGSGGESRGGSGSTSTAYCGDDRWSDQDICCYKHTGPAGPPGQYDGVRTCNAGYIMSGDPPAPIYIPNCGKEGAKCEREVSLSAGGPLLSCLFTACKPGRNAIWDPQTKRCGCDDGGGGFSTLADSGDQIEGDTGDSTEGTRGSASDAENRKKLADMGITVNHPEPQTSVAGLQDKTLTDLQALRSDCPDCGLEVVGATEAGHGSSGHANGSMVDLKPNGKLDNFIKNGNWPTRPGNLGTVYTVTLSNGSRVDFMDENVQGSSGISWSRHWHTNF